ncbi:hypothetical protein KVR01_013392 [Diaporthe batatas]|uniref:uncharacterized protein n=1 Tax=Diaporthe batatas TaxID=748121 RepID=UPI001D04E57B|nr:uncharacterized protein KVR01_013392 [Diaporthe batatas]KAG8156787.1 hypothetical protein KVR01_013392 [Diaporthe batatas]
MSFLSPAGLTNFGVFAVVAGLCIGLASVVEARLDRLGREGRDRRCLGFAWVLAVWLWVLRRRAAAVHLVRRALGRDEVLDIIDLYALEAGRNRRQD